MSDLTHDTEVKALAVRLKRELGRSIARRRVHLGLSQNALSDAAGVSKKYMGEVERGRANVTVDTLARIAYPLEWDPWTLFGDQPQAVSKNAHQLITADVDGATKHLVSLSTWLAGLDPLIRAPLANSVETSDKENSDDQPQRPLRLRPGRRTFRHPARLARER